MPLSMYLGVQCLCSVDISVYKDRAGAMGEQIVVGNLKIDLEAYRLTKDGKPIRLTRTEWSLLGELVRHRNQVLSHRTLLQRVWGVEYGSESDYVHTYVSRLRRKLEENPAEPQFILTEPGVGYVFQRDHSRQTIPLPNPTITPLKPIFRKLNPPPLVVDYYVGREAERALIKQHLRERVPLVSLYGRGGVGKTALACKVMEDLEAEGEFDGMVLLSDIGTGISLERIVADFNRLLNIEEAPPTERQEANRIISTLLERLSDGNYLLLLDNLETYQVEATGTLINPDLQTFFQMVLLQGGALRVLATSREPLALPRQLKVRERVLTLEEGLSEADSILLLRKCDPENQAGLRDAPDEALQDIVLRTRGFPRALEAVAGLLLDDPFLTLDTLLNNEQQLAGEVQEILVQNALVRLDAPTQRAMQLVAAVARPLTQAELSEIATPFMDEDAFKTALARLVKTFFLKYDPQSGQVSVHPMDRAYAYAQIPVASADGYDRGALHREIAAFYRRRQKPLAEITQYPDLQPYQNEFWQLVNAQEMVAAAELARRLDMEYFARRGSLSRLVNMYSAVLPYIEEPALKRTITLRLGEAYRSSGRIQDAILCYEAVLRHIDADQTAEHGEALYHLAWAYYDLGNFEQAQRQWEQALSVFDGLADWGRTGAAYGGMGWVSYLLGKYEYADEFFRKAISFFRRIGDTASVVINEGDLGVVKLAREDYPQAIRYLNLAQQAADDLQLRNEYSYKGAYLTVAYLLSGDLVAAAHAVQLVRQEREILVNLPFVLALDGVIRTRLGNAEQAEIAFTEAVATADTLLKLENGLYHVLYARALALVGLALLHQADLTEAQNAYERAVTVCGAAGVVAFHRRLLETLFYEKDGMLSFSAIFD